MSHGIGNARISTNAATADTKIAAAAIGEGRNAT
jgi:hypothetical protein